MKNIAHWSRWRLSTAAFILATLGATMAVPWRLVAEQSALAAAPPIVSEPIEVKGNPPTTTTKAVEAQIVKLPAKVVVPTRVLRAPINGTVAKVQATLGQAVKAGKLLVQFDDTDAQTELDKAVAELDLSRSQLERENEARRANSISADDLEQAKAKTAVAEASVRRAQHAVDVTRMTAPFDGIVSQCDAQTGDVETAGQPLVTLLRAGPPMVQFDLPQACVGCVAPGSTLTVILSQRDQSPATFAAKVTAVAPALDPKTGTQQISAQLNADAPGLLSGMFVQVQFSPAKSVSAPAR